MKLLKHKAQRSIADVSEGIIVELLDSCAVEPVAAGTGPVKTTKNVHGGAFAGTACAHHSEIVAAFNGQIETVECSDFQITSAIDLVDVVEFSNDIRTGSTRVSQGQPVTIGQWPAAAAASLSQQRWPTGTRGWTGCPRWL